MFKKIAPMIGLFLIYSPLGGAEEPGYSEAMDYFIFRDKNKQKERPPQRDNFVEPQVSPQGSKADVSVDKPQNIIINPRKHFFGLGVGETFGAEHYSLELGIAYIQSRYFQQSIHLEYLYFNAREFDEYRSGQISNTYGQGLFLVHNVQLTSQSFYFGPELSAGVGRFFDRPREGSLLTMKAGIFYSNKWSQKMLFSMHLYYRRNQYFKKDHHGDGLGLTLRVGF